MSHPKRNGAIIAQEEVDGDLAAAALASIEFDIQRYLSAEQFAKEFQQTLLDPGTSENRPPSVVLLAGPLENLANGRAAATARAVSPFLPIITTGPGGDVRAAVDLMKQGACDVVSLPCDPSQLGKRILDVVDQADAQTAERVQSTLLRARLDQLTKAEEDVLSAMLEGLANKQMAQRLSIGLRTVELRRSKIMRKMKAKSVAQLVKLICLAGGIQGHQTCA